MRTSCGVRTTASSIAGAAVLVAALVLTTAAPDAQRRRGNDNAAQGAPVATNMILENPDAYYGQLVTVSAGVEGMLSKTAFLVDQRKAVSATEMQALGRPMLVIAPYLSSPVEPRNYLMVRGQVVKFDAAAIGRVAADYTLDLSPEVGAKYAGQPVLIATSVLNSRYAEMNRKPLIPEEIALAAVMKKVAPAFAALRAATQDAKADAVAPNVATLMPAFSQTAKVWEDIGQAPAAEWAREAREHTAAIERAAAAGNWDAAKTSATALNQVCANCHAIYRERQDDGAFRFKAGSF